ncbi:phospholysine phosphohistidine inorganic pyrophosphate phosphatase-like protein [Dinothrombium tinctorium]|uniref:Phospholysine phosphohistidine inorganic pyrophosphate phosphatase-like protein n=1 Tax=Dinothrombium tinctorium TaxID=1965070 RepID=A0A3S3NP00_9ACAR|nr:phospholysine phosphohistidine inorganic pyrophosphate phosphatase-like protein [Dinothrombium tinctorium]RWS03224.1 phospholysine phosphohistidine inorganic pyrophosphate phosphatase-like protein [Dinothrombium tinctorium]RWS04305.1 phospholysine phosphohistidine inorganic pyrophosphate phosphatase-like protein [Dinothrombium tinctorium]
MAKLLKTKPKALLIDVTGVLYESGLNKLIDGSLEAIRLLNSIQIKYKLVTNETQATREGLVSKLRRIGYEFTADDILSPGPVCRDFIIKHGLRPHLLIHPALNVKAEEAVMIGDDINSDVGGAQQCGIPGVLVRTGKFRPERDLNHPTIKPNAIVDNLLQFVQWMIKSN